MYSPEPDIIRPVNNILLDVDGGDVASLLRLLPVAVNSLLLAANSATPDADTAPQAHPQVAKVFQQ